MSNEMIADAPEDVAIAAPGFAAPPVAEPPGPEATTTDNSSVANDPDLGIAPSHADEIVPVDFSPGEARASNPLLADLEPDAATGSETPPPPAVPDPMLDELNRPWEEMGRRYQADLAAYRSEGLRNAANRSLAGRDGAGNRDLDLSFDTDPDKAFDQVISHAVVTAMNNGEPVPGGDTGYRLALDRASNLLFGEAANGDESVFAGKFKSWSQQRQDRQELGKTLATQASQAALFEAVDPGKASPSSWTAFLAQAQESPGYRPGDDSGLFDSWHAVQAQTLDRYKPVLPAVTQVWNAMQRGGAGTASEVGKALLADLFDPKPNLFDATRAELGKKDAAATALEIYPQLDPKDRPAFMEALGLMARSFPKDQQVTFWNNMEKTGGRAIDDLVRDINSVPRSGDDIIGFGDFGIGTDTTEKLRSQLQEQRKQLLLARNFASDVRQIERQDYDPVKSAWGDGDTPGFVESALYDIPGAAAMVGLTAIPYAGQALFLSSLEGHSYDLLRDQLRRAGMSDELASAYADNWSGVLAVPLTALGSLRAESALARIPLLEKLLPKIGDYFESAAARTAMRLTVSSGEQAGIQMVQGQLPYLMQDLGAAFSQAIPGVQWSNGKDGPLDGLWTEAGKSVITMLPFSLLTGIRGMQRDASSRGFAEKPPLERSAYGFTAEANADIEAASAKGQSSLNEAVDRALETRDPNSDTAKSALAELDAQQAANPSQEDTGQDPVIRRTDDSYTVYDPKTGEVIGTAADEGGAVKLAQSHLEAARFAEAQQAGEAPKLVTTEEGSVALHPETGELLGPPGTVEEAYRQAKKYVEEERSMRGRTAYQETNAGDPQPSVLEDGGGRKKTALDYLGEGREKGAALVSKAMKALGIDYVELSREAGVNSEAASLSNKPEKFDARIVSLAKQLKDPSNDPSDVLARHNREVVNFLHGEAGVPLETMERWIRDTEQATSKSFLPEDFAAMAPKARLEAIGKAWQNITARHLLPGRKGAIAARDMPHEFRSLIQQNAMVTELAGKTNPREIELLAGERKSDADALERSWIDQATKLQEKFERLLTGTGKSQYSGGSTRFFDLMREERQIAKLKAEVLLIYRRGDGSYFSSAAGKLREVNLPYPHDLPPEGVIIIHNHPSGAGPSTSDIGNVLRYENSIFRIIARQPDGSFDVYQLRASPEKVFPDWKGAQNEAWTKLKKQLELVHKDAARVKTKEGSLKALRALKNAAGGTLEIEMRNIR